MQGPHIEEPELLLIIATSVAFGFIYAGILPLFGLQGTPFLHVGVGLLLIGVSILAYLWQTRENYKHHLAGD